MSEQIRPSAASEHRLDRSETQERHTAGAQAPPTSVEPVAPQDPQAQGAATAEKHSLLQDNVSGSHQKGAAQQAHEHNQQQPGGTAGVHSTGSYTGASHQGKGTP